MWELLRDARIVLPVVTELELVEANGFPVGFATPVPGGGG